MAWKTAGAESSGNVVGQFNNITKWTVTGQTVEGILESRTQGKYGELINIRVRKAGGEDPLMTYPVHTVLTNKLKEVKIGDRVHIEYLGKVRGKSGAEYKDFAVLYDDGASEPIVQSPEKQAQYLANQAEYDERLADARSKLALIRTDAEMVAAGQKDIVAEYGRLYALLVKAKGEAVAKLIGQTCALSSDPAEALAKALEQLGVVPF